MDETFDCARVRPLLAELATGAATGIDRDRALRHVETCVACQHELAELALAADQLLLMVPDREPPAGFETAVMSRIAGLAELRQASDATENPSRPPHRSARPRGRTASRRPTRIAAGATALLLAAGIGAGVTYASGNADRRLADRYRQTAAGAGYTDAAPVTSADGTVVGHLYVYQGAPAWAIVALTAAPASGSWNMSIVTRDGLRYPMGVCTVTGQRGVTGYALPMPVDQIAAVDLDQGDIRLTVRPG
jgi:hypothetical protein